MSNIQPGILIKPVSFQTLARHCDVRRVLDGKIGRAGVKTGGFRNLRVQVPPIARRRQSHFAAPVKLRLRHPRPGITLLVRIVDAHRQVPSGAWRPFHKRGVRVGGGGQLLFLRQRPGWPTALGVGTSEDAHVLRQHIDPGVSRHETHPGNRPLRSEIQDEGRGHWRRRLGRADCRGLSRAGVVQQAGVGAQVAVDHLLRRVLARGIRVTLSIGPHGDRPELRGAQRAGEQKQRQDGRDALDARMAVVHEINFPLSWSRGHRCGNRNSQRSRPVSCLIKAVSWGS